MDQPSLASCKRLQTEPTPGGPQQQVFYALVLTNDQQHTFAITVTDGQTAWRGTGLKVSRPPGFTEAEAWARGRELLTDVNPAARPAALRAQELPGGDLQFVWSWEREVGAGRHVMKLPDPSSSAAAAAAAAAAPAAAVTAAAAEQQQQPGVLLKQQPPHTAVSHILDTLVTSYGQLQSSLAVCGSCQASLSSSLEVLRGQLDSQAAAHKERERELYLKFTMLLNQKTRQLQREHELVKQLSAEVTRLKGEADADTDDEAMQAAYAADEAAADGLLPGPEDAAAAAAAAADTEPGSDEGGPHAPQAPINVAAAAAAAAAAGRAGSSRGGLVIPDSEGVEEGEPGGGGGVAPMAVGYDLAAETQLLPEGELEQYYT